ncbi:uncharacterized protein LOC129591773 [Paramacrobiotus metropolitanus]|uniref:uncharacterized protein LOC129591773 n=1 Tax=Paramacrobiotus metropolitanus TaxID=2943436 RepID=UPI002445C844|nr:uncharacterized protein LOC129591773 [Paramacrobiotus metropolitanus]
MQHAQIGSTCQYHRANTRKIGYGSIGEDFQAAITNRGDYTGNDTVAARRVYMQYTAFLENPSNYARFRERLHIILRLTHNHIVKYHKVAVCPTLVGANFEFLMDYYPGGSLKTRIETMKNSKTLLDPSRAVQYSIHLADGLSFLHQNNLTHGDLKPENVLIECAGDGRPEKLLISDVDGLVTLLRDAISSLSLWHGRSSARYQSPEILGAFTIAAREDVWSAIPGAKTDVWSLGSIMLDLLRCITGDHQEVLRNPVTGKVMGQERRLGSMEFQAAVVVHGCIPVVNAPPPVPPQLAECVRCCLQVHVNERLSAEELLRKLDYCAL